LRAAVLRKSRPVWGLPGPLLFGRGPSLVALPIPLPAAGVERQGCDCRGSGAASARPGDTGLAHGPWACRPAHGCAGVLPGPGCRGRSAIAADRLADQLEWTAGRKPPHRRWRTLRRGTAGPLAESQDRAEGGAVPAAGGAPVDRSWAGPISWGWLAHRTAGRAWRRSRPLRRSGAGVPVRCPWARDGAGGPLGAGRKGSLGLAGRRRGLIRPEGAGPGPGLGWF